MILSLVGFIKMCEKNNFNFLRLVLSLSILLVHAAGISESMKLSIILDYLNGDVVVKCFFAISGYLVALSFQRNNVKDFFLKRARRILPAYYVVLLLMLCLGFILTNAPKMDFIFNNDVFKYVAFNSIFLNFIHPSLPGVFAYNPITAMNGSLWTIKSEIMLYIITPFLISKSRYRSLSLVLLYCASVLWVMWFVYVHVTVSSRTMSLQFVGMASYYAIGAFVAINKISKKNIGLMFFMSAVLWLFFSTDVFGVFIEPFIIVFSVLFFCLCFPVIKCIGNSVDLSYGIYLYNFPVVQVLINAGFFRDNPYLALFLSFVITISMASISWFVIERRFRGLGRNGTVNAVKWLL